MNNSGKRVHTGVLAATGLLVTAATALADIEVELATLHVHVAGSSADPVGAGTPFDFAHTVTSPGGDGSTFHSTSPGPAHGWSSTGRYGYSYFLHEDAFSHITDFGGSGLAEAGVTGSPGITGSGSAMATSDATLRLTVGPPQLVHLSGSLTAHSTPGGSATAYITIHIASGFPGAGTLIWSETETSGTTTFDLDLLLPTSGYVLYANSEAFASGAHPAGPFPPGGGDASYSYTMTMIPAPSSGLLLGALGLCAARRRRD